MLIPYHAEGFRTILLLESDDIALMNAVNMKNGIETSFPAGFAVGLDEFWFPDPRRTSIASQLGQTHAA